MARKKATRRKQTRGANRKTYILKTGKALAIFTGRSPRQAALKAATRGIANIKLRERGRRNQDGTYSIHVFKGSRKKMNLQTEGRPEWLPKSVWKPRVAKVRVERVEKL